MLSKSLSDLILISNLLTKNNNNDNSCSSSSSTSSSDCLGTLKFDSNDNQSINLSDYSSSSISSTSTTESKLKPKSTTTLQRPITMITFPKPRENLSSITNYQSTMDSIDNQSNCSELTISSTIQHFGQYISTDNNNNNMKNEPIQNQPSIMMMIIYRYQNRLIKIIQYYHH
ncbi:hypothetical protein DERP_008319 [Dermatophagoides pteronyssinus]|uniref:Uncharacterized protein n=1 Tax=Dermatophagoides pteronyssinus TaxID=6956 RepID=A0ABQ8J6A1_DERPT|nr:hypothetical protein DERP_008319 [Dermatophagoides pteronyssinus]